MTTTEFLVGAHVSAAGGVHNAPENAHSIGANAFALFTKNQRQWKAPPLDPVVVQAFGERCQALGFGPEQILPHNSYLINPGHPEQAGLDKSRQALLDELQRCEQLGIPRLNIHPGSHLSKSSESECLRRIAETINLMHEQTLTVSIVLENTAGQGSNLGHRFEHLAEIIDQVQDRRRVGFCIDTCHAHAAGYNMTTPEGYQEVMDQADRIVGLSMLQGMHLNDAKTALGSRVDRHAPLGKGTMGTEVFRQIMRDERLRGIPMILETTEPDNWQQEIAWLRSLQVS